MAGRSYSGVLTRKISRRKALELLNAGKLDCGVLVPAYRGDEAWLAGKKENALIVAEDHTPPSAKLRRFYWAVLAKVVDNHPLFTDRVTLNVAIKHGLDYYDWSFDQNGDPIKVLRSNSALERNWEEYKVFCDRAFDLIVAGILPGSKAELIREIEEDLGLTLKDALKGNRGKDTGELYEEEYDADPDQ